MADNKKLQDYVNAVYQNAKVGMQSIHDILPDVKNIELKRELKREYEGYSSIAREIEDFASSKDIEAKENNFFEKAGMWTSVKMSTTSDNSTRHLAEMLLLGTVMGITTCYKDLCDHKNLSNEMDNILHELEDMQEKNYSSIKEFLKLKCKD